MKEIIGWALLMMAIACYRTQRFGVHYAKELFLQFAQLDGPPEKGSGNSEQPDLIQNGMLDVGFLRLPIDTPESIDITPVHREPFVAIFPLGHPLASKGGIRLRDLRGEKFVMYERAFAPGYHDLVIGILGQAGVIPEVSQTASEMSTIVSLVDSGMGVAVVPMSATKHRIARIATCPILDKVPISEIAMVTAKDTDIPVMRRFYELARELCRP